jgi:hypothetical protein
MSAEEALARASAAEKLVNDPILTEAFELVRKTILTNIEDAPIRDRAGVQESRLMLKLLKSVRGHLEQAVRDGKVIVHRLEERKRAEQALAEEKRRITPAAFAANYRR